MAQELIYTSAARGLQPGTRGFCTVAYTRGMGAAAVRFLEAISAYRGIYGDNDPRAAGNPQAYSHYRCTIENAACSVISRIGPSGVDHTKRGNKMAHHLLLGRRELCPAGPARLAAAPGLFRDAWDDEPRLLDAPPALPPASLQEQSIPPGPAATWGRLTGDPGWAGALAYQFLRSPQKPAFIIFDPGMPTLELLAEALDLLEPEKRWQVTFNSYFTQLPAGVSCAWRCCATDTPAERDSRRQPGAFIIDLTRPPAGPCPETPLTAPARTGGAAMTATKESA